MTFARQVPSFHRDPIDTHCTNCYNDVSNMSWRADGNVTFEFLARKTEVVYQAKDQTILGKTWCVLFPTAQSVANIAKIHLIWNPKKSFAGNLVVATTQR